MRKRSAHHLNYFSVQYDGSESPCSGFVSIFRKAVMLKYLFLIPLALFVLALFYGANADTESGTPMSAAEVKTLLTGNSLAGNGKVKDPAEPYDWVAHYAENGSLRLCLKPEWGGGVMKGRWWLNEIGHLCREFETGHGKEGCWRFVREGEFVRFIPVSGVAVEGRAVMIKGNALD